MERTCVSETPRISLIEVTLLDEARVIQMTKITKALSDPIRVQILHLLNQHKDLCTCEFEEILGLSQSNVSYHVKQLLDVGAITREIHGTWSHYYLARTDILVFLQSLTSP